MVLKLLGLVVLGFATAAPAADIVMKTSDAKELPYTWSGAICTLGQSDLAVVTNKGEARSGRLNFYFRNFKDTVDKLGADPIALEIASTMEMGMSFLDRDDEEWAFRPRRNSARCKLQLKKSGKDGLVMWGSCTKLTPRDPEESFCQSIEVTEASPISCQLKTAN